MNDDLLIPTLIATGVAAIAVALASLLRRHRRPPPGLWHGPNKDLSGPLSFPQTGLELTGTSVPNAPPPTEQPSPRAPRAVPDLDPGNFAPLQTDQVKQQAARVGFGAWWFGSRDVIPPATDPRTLLIDRAMVGQGLLTPEELAEMHRVGDEMARLRPQLGGAGAVAEAAVLADQEERRRIREQKKAEAAERKRLHAEQVALRRQTDIIYLGRGVSRGLADRRANVEKLSAGGLPVLATPADVAAALKITIPRLRWLAFHSDASESSHYVRFTVPKRSGGTRALFAPHHDLAAAQQWVLDNILAKLPFHDAAHGFVPGRSTVTNASGHVGSEVLVNCDLSDFFPTITFPRVRGAFQMLGYSPAAAIILALLCTECPRRKVIYAGRTFHVATGPRALPQGACTSPALSNLVSRRMDARLAGIATKLGWHYTRYADDLSFSASGPPAEKIGYLLARVRHIARDEGFIVNETKTRVLRPSAAQTITGIVVNERAGVPRHVVRRLRAILHRARAEGLAAQNRENRPYFESWLRGMIAYVHMVNPQQAEPLRKALEQLS